LGNKRKKKQEVLKGVAKHRISQNLPIHHARLPTAKELDGHPEAKTLRKELIPAILVIELPILEIPVIEQAQVVAMIAQDRAIEAINVQAIHVRVLMDLVNNVLVVEMPPRLNLAPPAEAPHTLTIIRIRTKNTVRPLNILSLDQHPGHPLCRNPLSSLLR
jgi:hypothetical protein